MPTRLRTNGPLPCAHGRRARRGSPSAPRARRASPSTTSSRHSSGRTLPSSSPGRKERVVEPIEDLHKFRVATRRIRSLLRSTRGQLVDRVEGERLRASSKWLASLLGEVRDRDVLIDYLVGELDSLDGAPLGALLQVVDEERDQARRDLVVALDSPRFAELRASLGHPPRLREEKPSAGRRNANTSACARPLMRLTRMRSTRTPQGADPRQARSLRGRGGRRRRRARRQGEELQKPLGNTGTVVAEAAVRDLLGRVRGTGRTAFAAGRLVERQQARKEHARRAWPSAWKRLGRPGTTFVGDDPGPRRRRPSPRRRAARPPSEVRRLDVSEEQGEGRRE